MFRMHYHEVQMPPSMVQTQRNITGWRLESQGVRRHALRLVRSTGCPSTEMLEGSSMSCSSSGVATVPLSKRTCTCHDISRVDSFSISVFSETVDTGEA